MAAATKKELGTPWLVEFINEECGTDYDPAQMRVMLRTLAERDKIKRDTEGPRARWLFSGKTDPNVKAILKHIKSGDAEKERQAKLEELKEKREKAAAKKAEAPAKKAPAKKAPAKKAAPAPVEDDLELDDDLDDLDD